MPEKTHGQNCAVEHICNLHGGAECEVTTEPSGQVVLQVEGAIYRITKLGHFTLMNPKTRNQGRVI